MSGLRIIGVALPLLALSAGSVVAQELEKPNLDFIGLQYVYGTADVSTDRLPEASTSGNWYYDEGVQVDASYVVFDQFLLRGSYYDASGDYRAGPDIDFSTANVAIGILAPTDADDPVNIDASIEWRSDEIEFGSTDETIDGIGFSFGVSANIAPEHELSLRVGGYMGDFDQAVSLKLGYAWNFTERFGLTASYEYIDVGTDDDDPLDYELSKWLVGGRFYF